MTYSCLLPVVDKLDGTLRNQYHNDIHRLSRFVIGILPTKTTIQSVPIDAANILILDNSNFERWFEIFTNSKDT